MKKEDKEIEEKVEEFKKEFIQDNGEEVEDSFKDASGDGGRTIVWIRQALQDITDEVEKEAYKKGYNACLKEMRIKNEMGEKSL